MLQEFEDLIATRVVPSTNPRVAELERSLAHVWSREAFDELATLAHSGDSAAQYWLGRHYETATALASTADATRWYRASAQQGQWAAELRWARIARPQLRDAAYSAFHATRLLIEAKASAGDVNAEAWMGDFCRWGLAGNADMASATRWYRLAAGRGHAGALLLLGALLEREPDPSDETRLEALAFWLRAGMAGEVLAQYYVGVHYRDGSGCSQNPTLAARWLRAAATQGHAPAAAAVRQLESAGIVRLNGNPAAVELYVAGRNHEFMRDGWATLGIEDTWTVGTRAAVRLPVIERDRDHILKLDIGGIFPPWGFGMQRLIARAGEITVGEIICRGAAVFEFFVPASACAADGWVDVALELPDAQSPADHGESDHRFLALRLASIELCAVSESDRTRVPATREISAQRAALIAMQSLGVNCEFGFLQREYGAEPLGLFRWTLAPLDKLVLALTQEFRGLTQKNVLNIQMNEDTEFVIEDPVYGFRHHTFLFASQGATLAMVKRGELLRVGMLTQSLLEELREQRKLFVYHDAGQSSLPDVRRLLVALRHYGPNTLLWIVGPRPDATVGEARWLEPGLIEGSVSGFQTPVDIVIPESVHRPSWLSVACNAYRLWLDRPHP